MIELFPINCVGCGLRTVALWASHGQVYAICSTCFNYIHLVKVAAIDPATLPEPSQIEARGKSQECRPAG